MAPKALGLGVLAFVLLEANSWMGEDSTRAALDAVPQVEEAHIIAGPATVLLKVRATSTTELQSVLRALHEIEGVTTTQTIVVLESVFERTPHVAPTPASTPTPTPGPVPGPVPTPAP